MDAVRTHVSRAYEKGIRMRMSSARMTTTSILGFRGAVGTAGRGLDWEVWYTSCWMSSGTFWHFCMDIRNGRSTQRCSFGHDRFLEVTEKLDVQTRESTDNAFAVGSNPVKNGVGKKVFEAISMEIHTRKKFSRSGIGKEWQFRHPVPGMKQRKQKNPRQQHTFRNIESSELSATQSH